MNDLIITTQGSKIDHHSFHGMLSVFPEVYSEPFTEKDKEGLIAIVRLPKELIVNASELLSSMFEEKQLNILLISQMYGKRYRLPIEKYDTLFKQWRYTSEDIRR
ncbi:MAG: hypothetical protein ACTSPO_15210 [Candidatus Heimdallarchaeaceae archaeon]